ncbi:phosphatidylserine/phosphatidylglycerophosphate/cardiolipin synthase family protein [Saccharicrinis sp. FJH54]|uniref:phospholipase D-like domain-containing protein n=1 Tax=Saccharicrinis sp. FJH54 TaxID=3344665 RepID=UPI0035D4FF2C
MNFFKISTSDSNHVGRNIKDFLNNDFFQATLLFIPVIFFTDLSSLIYDFKKDPIADTVFLIMLYVLAWMIIMLIHKLRSESDAVFNEDVKTELNDIINSARRSLIIVSPFIAPGDVVTESIISQARRGVKILFIVNENQLKSYDAYRLFKRLNAVGGEMWCHPRLHAKIYMNEKNLLVTSLNLLTSSFDNSIEAGVKLNDKYYRSHIRNYIEQDLLKSDLIESVSFDSFDIKYGFCIRTRKTINLNPDKPIQYSEYLSSGRQVNGKYCHICGNEAETSVDQPFCKEHSNYKHI